MQCNGNGNLYPYTMGWRKDEREENRINTTIQEEVCELAKT